MPPVRRPYSSVDGLGVGAVSFVGCVVLHEHPGQPTCQERSLRGVHGERRTEEEGEEDEGVTDGGGRKSGRKEG